VRANELERREVHEQVALDQLHGNIAVDMVGTNVMDDRVARARDVHHGRHAGSKLFG
jgi:hypothetical protein